MPIDDNDNQPWWAHALNALAAGYDLTSKRRAAAQAQADAEQDQRRRQRERNRNANTDSSAGFGSAAPRRRIKRVPDEPCCDGPRRK